MLKIDEKSSHTDGFNMI